MAAGMTKTQLVRHLAEKTGNQQQDRRSISRAPG